MSHSRKHPLSIGETVFPRQWFNHPPRGLYQDIEGKATITAPSDKPHHYLVIFEGEAEPCERALDEFSTREELPL